MSIDHALGIEVKGPLVALLALAGGIVGSYLMTRPSGDGGEPPVADEAPAPGAGRRRRLSVAGATPESIRCKSTAGLTLGGQDR